MTEADLLDLIRWLALRYGDNEPVFAVETAFSGQPLPEGVRRQATWQAIFGEKTPPPSGLAWRQCPECRQWYVHSPGPERRTTDQEADEMAKRAADHLSIW